MRKTVYPLACAILFAVVAMGAKRPDAFDGRWAVTVTPEDGGKAYADTLTFAGGRFVSEACKKHGFTEAAYEADVRGGQAGTFTATAKGDMAGTAKWTGTAAGAEISGSFAWTRAGGGVETFAFRGVRVLK